MRFLVVQTIGDIPKSKPVLPRGGILRFYSPKSEIYVRNKWERLLNHSDIKVCLNHFKAGHRSKDCPNSTLYLKGYSEMPSPKKRKKVLIPKYTHSYAKVVHKI